MARTCRYHDIPPHGQGEQEYQWESMPGLAYQRWPQDFSSWSCQFALQPSQESGPGDLGVLVLLPFLVVVAFLVLVSFLVVVLSVQTPAILVI